QTHPDEVDSSAVVHAAAEIHQPPRAMDEGGEQVRGDNIDRQNLWAAVDAGVVNRPRALGAVGGGEGLGGGGVHDDLVPAAEQNLGGCPTQPAGGTGDEDACHL